jgi:hypothetical protein
VRVPERRDQGGGGPREERTGREGSLGGQDWVRAVSLGEDRLRHLMR